MVEGTKLDQAEFIDMGSLSRDSAFNVSAQGVRKGCDCLVGCWAEIQTKKWPTVSELKMLDLLWFNVEEGF